MISTSDFRKGSTKILWNNEPWLVVDYQSVKPGKGGTFIVTRMKNMITGRILEETFRSEEKFPEPDLEFKQMSYIYFDGLYNFMDQESYEQSAFSEDQIAQVKNYLKDGIVYNVVIFKGKPIMVEAPNHMVLEVVETIPGVKGNTAQGGSKPAKLETGVTIQVPLFIAEGNKVKVDTREDKYLGKE